MAGRVFVSMQNHYNLIYREEEREMMPLCEAEGVGVIPWSPLARGLLAGTRRSADDQTSTKRAESDDYARKLYDHAGDMEIVEAVRKVAAERGVQPAQVALAWLLSKPAVTAPIIGATKLEHLQAAVAGVNLQLSDEEIRRLESPYQPHAVRRIQLRATCGAGFQPAANRGRLQTCPTVMGLTMTALQIRGVCPHDCPDTCGIVTEVEDGRAVKVYADPEHPIAKGWLCAKVRPYLDHVYHPDRVLYPLRRVGPKGSGRFERTTWAEALAEIGKRWKEIIAQDGAEAILPYSYSGTLGLVQMTVASARLWNRLGASQLRRSICGAAAEYAVEATLGKRWSPPYVDVVHSKLVVIWGHNPVSTGPHFMPFLRQAQHRGCQVVVIDPRRTLTAKPPTITSLPCRAATGPWRWVWETSS